ncbi:MAG: helix-turn-helix domain-containing protein [Bacteroidota bacterium]
MNKNQPLKSLSPRQEYWLAQTKAVIVKEMKDPQFSVKSLAIAMSLSHSQLFRRLKVIVGLSPNQYIREIRLLSALELLETGQVDTVKEAALTVGLKDIAHFSRQFKERFGQLPSTFL